jgi:hypothetical protein
MESLAVGIARMREGFAGPNAGAVHELDCDREYACGDDVGDTGAGDV